MIDTIPELRKVLQRKLDPIRYEHSLSVSFTCISLAMCYGYDLHQAELAGLMHDCAKRFDDSTIIQKCEKHSLEITEDEWKAPAVLHAKYGAWMLEQKYQITNPEIISAVRFHTTGKPEMSLLEQILFVADYIEPRRFKAAGLDELRKLAWIDLNKTTYLIMKNTLEYLEHKECFIDSMTKEAYSYYRELIEIKTEE